MKFMTKGTKIILAVLILTIILLIGFGAYYLTQTKTGFFSKASTGPEVYSLDNSLLYASPMTARADGQEKIKISAFLLSGEGRGVAVKKIILTSQPSLQISEIQAETDSKGQAIFEVETTSAGRFIIQASIEGNVFPQSVTVSFN
jgi:hypothetical protein